MICVPALSHVDGDMATLVVGPFPQPGRTTPGVNAKNRREQINRPQPSIRLRNEGGNDVPGRATVLADCFRNLQKMTKHLEKLVRNFSDVTWFPPIYLGSAFLESPGCVADGGRREPREHVDIQFGVLPLREGAVNLPPVVPDLFLGLKLIRQRGGALGSTLRKWGCLVWLGDAVSPSCAVLADLGDFLFPILASDLSNVMAFLGGPFLGLRDEVLETFVQRAEWSLLQDCDVLG
jgi:hypothetical protein